MIEIIDKRVGQAMARFRGMVQFVTGLVVDSDGNASATGADDESIDSTVGYHFGFYSRPLDGARGLVLKVDGRGNTSVVIAFRDKQYELSLEKGECGMQNAFGASIVLDKAGVAKINGQTYSLLKTEDFFNDFKLFLTALATDLAAAAAAPVSPYTATANLTTFFTTMAAGGTSYKSIKVKNG